MRYLFADTETTGADDAAKVVEIGWIETDADWNILSQVESLIDPQQPIKPSASGIHGLVDADVADSPTIEEFFSDPSCYGQRLQGPLVLIGHRISFDRRFFEPFVDGEILELDTLRYVRHLYPDMDDHKLSTCKYALNLPRDCGEAHRVMADIMVAYHLAKHIAERLHMTLPELVEHAKKPMLIHSLPFGKHKGELIERVPRSYLQWMKREMELDFDTTFTINSILGPQK